MTLTMVPRMGSALSHYFCDLVSKWPLQHVNAMLLWRQGDFNCFKMFWLTLYATVCMLVQCDANDLEFDHVYKVNQSILKQSKPPWRHKSMLLKCCNGHFDTNFENWRVRADPVFITIFKVIHKLCLLILSNRSQMCIKLI